MNTLQIAQTDYRVLGQAAGGSCRCCLLELNLKTGFQHQLRVHQSHGLNAPIVGDKKFAGPVLWWQASDLLRRRTKLIDRAICKNVTYLHAYQLTIPEYIKNKNHSHFYCSTTCVLYTLYTLPTKTEHSSTTRTLFRNGNLENVIAIWNCCHCIFR